MDLIERIKTIMLAPAQAWREIVREPAGPAILLQTYVAALAAIPAVADFIGMAAIGYAVPGKGVVRVEVLPAFMAALFAYVMSFVIVSLQAIVIYALAPVYGARRDMAGAFRLAVYSFTPAWLAGIFLVVPGLHFLVILGLYGWYVLSTGMPLLILCPPERAVKFAGVATACGVIAALIIGFGRALLFSLPGIL
jgi:hypothetical protein